MSRPTTPPQHGERRCYLRGCRRDECRDAAYKYMSRYRLDRQRGKTRRVPAGPAQQRVAHLASQGWTAAQIAAAANCAERTALDLLAKRQRTVDPAIAKRLLRAEPTVETAPDRTYVNATGTIRRLHALVAIGHEVCAIADAIGFARTALSNVINGNYAKVTIKTARKVKALYAEWSQQPGTSRRSKNYAIKRGWRDPLWWEDMGHIDDPDFDPDTAEIENSRTLAEARRIDIAHLAACGTPEGVIASRLGMSTKYVQDQLRDMRRAGLRTAA